MLGLRRGGNLVLRQQSCARAGPTLQYTEAIDGLVSCQPQASLTGRNT